ncbi:histone deacetylase 10, chloroplastic isoform X2 [Magnolia sinica]|uniref:histone deacetylase 10, chloroplastic isoform X2 n=1 Tax=Magnolia sinica TaxID=86752 RepID=UPI0026594895|nr:histone deacetylase 10, chloroplastic isoform X2 [Magnolia sinica]
MGQQTMTTTAFEAGHLFPLIGNRMGNLKNHYAFGLKNRVLVLDKGFYKYPRSKRKYSSESNRACISCSSDILYVSSSNIELFEASVLYCAAPAMGHNQESHPESNFRVPTILSALEKMELTSKHRGSEVIEIQKFRPASVDDIASVHSRGYVIGLEKAMSKASEEGLIFIEGSGPTYATATTFQESLIAAGAGITLIDSVVAASRISQNPPVGFALIRPPGHHAIPKGPMGFCVFGNVAVAARYAQRVHGLKRVLIIDFDVHHGNGTSDAFYDDPDIFFISTHQDGSYPGTGKFEQVGHGNGEGTTLNLPLPGGSGDNTMRRVFDEVIAPSAQRFKPDIILVSAGYDAHVLDPLASLQFTTGTYYMLASNIKQLAKELCGGRCVFFLEGGYNLQSLSYSVADTFRALLGDPSMASHFDDPAILYEEPSTKVKEAIRRVKHIHSL